MTGGDEAEHPAAPGSVPAGRAGLIDAVLDLCARAPLDRTPAADQALTNALLPLVQAAQREVRQRLAERLAVADWAPRGVVLALALDEIDIARPVIGASPRLDDAALLHVLDVGDTPHRVAVARRPGLSAPVGERAAADSEPAVLAALAGNDTTRLSAAALGLLVEGARRLAALRAPLARRQDLGADLALKLYGLVGEGLRAEIAARFALPPAALAQAVNAAVAGAGAAESDPDREEMERRLVEKLQAAGQLRPGYLLRSLREGRLSLFEAALASLAALPREAVRDAVRGPGPERLALACVAAGLDRSVFPTVLALVRDQANGAPADRPDSLLKVRSALQGPDADRARALFLQDAAA